MDLLHLLARWQNRRLFFQACLDLSIIIMMSQMTQLRLPVLLSSWHISSIALGVSTFLDLLISYDFPLQFHFLDWGWYLVKSEVLTIYIGIWNIVWIFGHCVDSFVLLLVELSLFWLPSCRNFSLIDRLKIRVLHLSISLTSIPILHVLNLDFLILHDHI